MPRNSRSPRIAVTKPRISLAKIIAWVRSSIQLILALFLMILSVVVIVPLLSVKPLVPKSFSGLDVLHDCTGNPEIFLSIILKSENTAEVSLVIQNWEEIGENCNTLQIHIPGTITLPLYVSKFQENSDALPIGFGDELKFLHNYRGLGADVLEFHPKDLDNFTGGIKFTWLNVLDALDYYSAGLYIPIQAIQDPEDSLKESKVFAFSILSPEGWYFEKSIPEVSAYQSNVKTESLLFDVTATKADLAIRYTNSSRQKSQNYLLLVFTAMFGIGITLGVEDLIAKIKGSND